MNIREAILEHFEDAVKRRRHLHMYPEPSFQEFKTKQYIYDELKNLPLEIERDVGGNGVVARLIVDELYDTLAFRADFDALLIQEENDVPYKSKNDGVMHACGHDAHTAALITFAHILSEHKDELPVNVVLIFQHAEERVPGGAKSMIEDGCLDGVDYFFGTHVASLKPVHEFGWNYESMYANADTFTITATGKGGHGAAPHTTHDPVVASAYLIEQLQSIVSRNVDPLESAVLSVTAFNAGKAFNVIPQYVEIKGTVRTYESDVRELVLSRIEEIAKGVGLAQNVDFDVEIHRGYPALKNDVKMTDYVRSLAEKDVDFVESVVKLPPSMGGEDAAYYLQKVPGCYFSTGVGNVDKEITHPHHHPKFDIDEDGMKSVLELFLKIVMNFGEFEK